MFHRCCCMALLDSSWEFKPGFLWFEREPRVSWCFQDTRKVGGSGANRENGALYKEMVAATTQNTIYSTNTVPSSTLQWSVRQLESVRPLWLRQSYLPPASRGSRALSSENQREKENPTKAQKRWPNWVRAGTIHHKAAPKLKETMWETLWGQIWGIWGGYWGVWEGAHIISSISCSPSFARAASFTRNVDTFCSGSHPHGMFIVALFLNERCARALEGQIKVEMTRKWVAWLHDKGLTMTGAGGGWPHNKKCDSYKTSRSQCAWIWLKLKFFLKK